MEQPVRPRKSATPTRVRKRRRQVRVFRFIGVWVMGGWVVMFIRVLGSWFLVLG